MQFRVENINNVKVIRVAILINDIDLQKRKNDPSKVFVDLEKSKYNISNKNNISKNNNIIDTSKQDIDTRVIAFIFQTFTSKPAFDLVFEIFTINLDFKKLCTTCVTSKFT